MSKLTDKDVRIVYLPPATVAASHYIGEEPENHVAKIINKFVLENDLPNVKPDLRHYGFNAPDPDETGAHGYEMWVTIPDDMEVPAPLEKKHFPGGLYGAHMIPMGAFEEWQWLADWVEKGSKLYAYRADTSRGYDNMNGLLEEQLNYRNRVWRLEDGIFDDMQLDLLMPIKEKNE